MCPPLWGGLCAQLEELLLGGVWGCLSDSLFTPQPYKALALFHSKPLRLHFSAGIFVCVRATVTIMNRGPLIRTSMEL